MNKPQAPTTLFHNGYFWRGKEAEKQYGWMLVKDNKIIDMGEGTVNPDNGVVSINLNGRHIIPGLVDCHTHLTVSAWLPYTMDGSQWRSKQQLLGAINKAAMSLDSDAWLIAFYLDFHQVQDLPTSNELDEATGGRPVLLVEFGLHQSLASSKALAKSNVTKINFPHGYVDVKNGQPTGLLKEFANAQALDVALTEFSQQFSDLSVTGLIEAELERHLSMGITSCHDPCVHPKLQNLMERLSATNPIRLSWSHVHSHEDIELVSEDICLSCGEGPRSAKVFLDGGSDCALCVNPSDIIKMSAHVMLSAVRGQTKGLVSLTKVKMKYRDGKFHTDHLKKTPQELIKTLESVSKQGKRPKIHALGNAAVSCACHALNDIKLGDATIEHLTMMGKKEIDQVAESGAIASLQPGFLNSSAAVSDCYTDKALTIIPAKSLLRSGVKIALSSDNPCGPLDPLGNIQSAINRTSCTGRIINGEEALTASEAIAAYSVGGYRAIHGLDAPGLDIDSVADFVILSGPPDRALTRVISTWIDGERVWPS